MSTVQIFEDFVNSQKNDIHGLVFLHFLVDAVKNNSSTSFDNFDISVPLSPLPSVGLLQDDHAIVGSLNSFILAMNFKDLNDILRCSVGQEPNASWARLLLARIVLDLRLTKGTVTAVGENAIAPPSRAELWDAFSKKHCDREDLHCGARALCKHAHRASDEFWVSGCEVKGPASTKNRVADSVLSRIECEGMSPLGWRNIHMLPHGICTYELRNRMGYGARWQLMEGVWEFRGFLEPHQENGHTNGWQH